MTTLTKHKRAGSKAGNQYGTFKVRTASTRQVSFIEKLLQQKKHSIDVSQYDFTALNVQHATELIDVLIKCEDKVERLASDRQIEYLTYLGHNKIGGDVVLELLKQRTPTAKEVSILIDNLRNSENSKTITITETGAYRYNGIVYSIRKGRQSGNWQVFSLNNNAWEYDRKAYKYLYEIKDTDRLTLNEAIEASGQTGSCVHCGITLTALKSVTGGMGSTCAKKYKN
jgi:hypothetical protein